MSTVPRSNKGKHYPPPKRVRHVEDQPCPRRPFGEPHVLINFGAMVRCDHCGATWATLDAELNARLASRGEVA